MELNKIHNINFLDNTLPDKCANLIIADPPYFEVKGDFDFIWKSRLCLTVSSIGYNVSGIAEGVVY